MKQKMNPAMVGLIIAVVVAGVAYAGWALLIKPQQQSLPDGMSRADVEQKMKEHYGGGKMGDGLAPGHGGPPPGAPIGR